MRAPLLLVLLFAATSHAADKRLNVLFIISDDLNTRLGCYGDKVAQTPNLDALAARGVRFDRAYCQYPVCNPSRTSFLSGLYPDTTGVLDQNTQLRAHRMPNAVYLPEHFKNNGYFTAGVGKIEHGGRYEIKWDLADDFKGAGAGAGDGDGDDAPATRPRRRAAGGERPPRTPTKNQDGLTYEARRATEDGDPENVDDRIAARVVELLEQKRDQPFFIVAGFHKPHVPHVAPKRFFDLYPPDKLPLTFVPEGDTKDIPAAALASQRNYQPSMSPERQRAIMAAYYACVSYLDAKVGEVMSALDRQNLWENTVVVFLGDHGWHFGEHNWWAKASLFEESARAPYLIIAPGAKSGVSPRIVQFLDTYATLTDLCGLPPPPQSQGKSLVPLLHDPQRPWDGVALTALSQRGRSLRTERYRYTEWDGGKAGIELYDHESDPYEHTNLASDPQHAETVAEMKKLLQATMPAAQTARQD